MPAYVNPEDGALMLHFGHNDIMIGAAEKAGKVADELIFWQRSEGASGEVGEICTDDVGKSTAEVKTYVRMIFDNPQALDVLIHQARELRALMGQDWPQWMPPEKKET